MSNVILQPVAKDHEKKTFEWVTDSEFRKNFMIRGEPSWETHIDYFENLIEDDTQLAYAIFMDEIHVGNCGFKYINNLVKSAEVWLYIGNIDVRGLGLGGSALNLLLNNGVNHLGLTDVFVHVAENNQAAINLYRNNGFFEICCLQY